MANNYFQFKQFTIHQDKCAMKVTTDACLFGAVVAAEFQNKHTKNILDIGAGTGLLSLMLAQKTTSQIDAIEIDETTYQQAKENFNASPFNKKLTIINADAKDHHSEKKYELIISNPPFFDNHLRSANAKKNAAKHTGSLSFEALINTVKNNLNDHGTFAVLLPFSAIEVFITTAKQADLYLIKNILAKQTPTHNYFRGILFFEKKQKELIENEITIKDANNNYTSAFTALLKDYYLNL